MLRDTKTTKGQGKSLWKKRELLIFQSFMMPLRVVKEANAQILDHPLKARLAYRSKERYSSLTVTSWASKPTPLLSSQERHILARQGVPWPSNLFNCSQQSVSKDESPNWSLNHTGIKHLYKAVTFCSSCLCCSPIPKLTKHPTEKWQSHSFVSPHQMQRTW